VEMGGAIFPKRSSWILNQACPEPVEGFRMT
jgi:hypothetical protein